MDKVRELLTKIFRAALGWEVRWAIRRSPWILHFGMRCCALEIPLAVAASRFDQERWGVIPPSSPRQVDILVVNGTVTKKMAHSIKILYDQMPEPKFVMAVGECAICGGPFKDSYSVVPGVDKVIPVDIYVPGCPPRPEAFIKAIEDFRRGIWGISE